MEHFKYSFFAIAPTGDLLPVRVTQQPDGSIRLEYTSMLAGRRHFLKCLFSILSIIFLKTCADILAIRSHILNMSVFFTVQRIVLLHLQLNDSDTDYLNTSTFRHN